MHLVMSCLSSNSHAMFARFSHTGATASPAVALVLTPGVCMEGCTRRKTRKGADVQRTGGAASGVLNPPPTVSLAAMHLAVAVPVSMTVALAAVALPLGHEGQQVPKLPNCS